MLGMTIRKGNKSSSLERHERTMRRKNEEERERKEEEIGVEDGKSSLGKTNGKKGTSIETKTAQRNDGHLRQRERERRFALPFSFSFYFSFSFFLILLLFLSFSFILSLVRIEEILPLARIQSR